jgi:hypothetical protein
MTVTIWPHGWSFHAFLLVLAVFLTGAVVGCWTGIYMYQTGWDDAKHVYGPHAHPNTAANQHQKGSTR